ncbi:MAG: lactate/malate dehydrogenase family protein [Fimbriimonadaceae bacterium]|nr:lactate/malate dehydrogenase family protein [Fimbriimonadaceae bacterium]
MKIGIIGGAGRVGSNAAFALQLRGLGRELVLVDVNQEAAAGEALDLLHGSALAAPQRFVAGGYDELAGADLVIVTAGLRRRPDESRLDLIHRNVALFRAILAELRQVELAPGAQLFVVANPVDVLTYLACRETDLDPHRIYGLGTVLDTLRLRSHLAAALAVDPRQVQALILGEHGDSQVPIWSTATVNGTPLESLPQATPRLLEEVAAQTKGSGAQVIQLKGGAGYAVGLAIAEVVAAVLADAQAVLPIATLQDGLLGVRDVCYSLPTVVGRAGWSTQVAPRLWAKEEQAMVNSGRVLRQTLDQIAAP